MGCAVDLSNIRQLGLDVRELLGLNVLKNVRVTLDFERRVMRFDPNVSVRGRRRASGGPARPAALVGPA